MAITRIIALFNLKPGVKVADYEDWARRVDLPTVNSLPSIKTFEVFKTAAVMGSEAAPPYGYVEILDVKDMAQFGADVSTPTMQGVAQDFARLADVTFLEMKKLGWRRRI